MDCYRSHCNMKQMYIHLCYWGFQQTSNRLGTVERILKLSNYTWIRNHCIKKVSQSWEQLVFERTGSLATKSLGQICNFITRTDEVSWWGTKTLLTINRQQLLHSEVHFSPALTRKTSEEFSSARRKPHTSKLKEWQGGGNGLYYGILLTHQKYKAQCMWDPWTGLKYTTLNHSHQCSRYLGAFCTSDYI